MGRNVDQYVARPPDKSKVAPVAKVQRSDASHATISATSSTSPKRFIGILLSMYWMCCSVIWLNSSVLTTAGATQFTSTPVVASSLPRDLVNPMTPALAAEYAEALGLPSLPATEAMLTMRPRPRLAMPPATARLHRKTPVRLTSITCFQASTG